MQRRIYGFAGLWLASTLACCLDLDALQSGFGTESDAAVVADAGGVSDGAGQTDLKSPADLPPSGPGCAAGPGVNVGEGSPFPVWACKGTFTAPNGLLGRCAAGFTICRSIQVGDVACKNVAGGIFIGMKGYRQATPFPPDQAQASYSWDGGGAQPRGIMYCGTLAAGGYEAPGAAAGFFRVVQCDQGTTPGVSSFGCPVVAGSDQDFGQVANSDPANGVLCCPTVSQ